MASWERLFRQWRNAGAAFLPRFGGSETDNGPLLDESILREINRLGLVSRGAYTEWLTGEHEGRRKTQAMEFADYRGYVPGDDFRQIDWYAYARLGELFVKTSTAPETITVSLLLDCSRSMDWGQPQNKLRYAKRLTAALGAVALLRSDRVQVFALADGQAQSGPPLLGPSSLVVLAEELEAIPVGGKTDLAASIAAYHQRSDPRGLVVLISDLLVPDESIAALKLLGTMGMAAVVLHIMDPAEITPTQNGTLQLHDLETGDMVTLTLTPRMREQYIRLFEARARRLEEVCSASDIEYLRVPTNIPPAQLLAGIFLDHRVLQV
jgi:uncharacterized protein (DUF58 family)